MALLLLLSNLLSFSSSLESRFFLSCFPNEVFLLETRGNYGFFLDSNQFLD